VLPSRRVLPHDRIRPSCRAWAGMTLPGSLDCSDTVCGVSGIAGSPCDWRRRACS
jgi:hypothetical protein